MCILSTNESHSRCALSDNHGGSGVPRVFGARGKLQNILGGAFSDLFSFFHHFLRPLGAGPRGSLPPFAPLP